MKESIIKRLTAVINALNSVSVSGKQNCANISGCIGVLEEITNGLSKCEITTDTTDSVAEEQK